MFHQRRVGLGLAVMLLCCMGILSSTAKADNLLFQGVFTQANQFQVFTFNVASSSQVTMRTLSYAGGTSAGGVNIARGGFDTLLSLFDSNGKLKSWNDDSSASNTDPLTDAQFDSFLRFTLSPGSYFLALTQAENQPAGNLLANGFVFPDGAVRTNFTDIKTDPPNMRDGHFAVEITGPSVMAPTTQPVPEPATMLLLGTGLAGVAARIRRRKNSNGA